MQIDYPEEFLENWNNIKKKSSQDKERNFTVYQLVKLHNKMFENKQTNVIEFGTDRGGGLTTISKFVKSDTRIFQLTVLVYTQRKLRKASRSMMNITMGNINLLQKTRFKDFSHLEMTEEINKILSEKFEIRNFGWIFSKTQR